MANILFFAHDPGGANAVKPIIEALKKDNYDFKVFGAGAALNILPDIVKFDGNTDELINNIQPDFVITGTSAACMTEKELRKSAKNSGIKTMSILDHWVNYGVRFTKYSTSDLDLYEKDRNFEYLPDYIIVMDEYAKEQMAKEGIPADIIYPFGNPHFASVKQDFKTINSEQLRYDLLENKEKLVVWGSEPYIEDYGHGMELEALKDVAELMPENWQLVIKPHPREKSDKFDEFKNVKIIRDKNSREVIKAADIVMSMTSMFLIEAIIAEKPTLSYQKGETDRNKFILTKMNALPFISDKIELKNLLNKPFEKPKFEIKFDAKEKIIKFIEEKLCQN